MKELKLLLSINLTLVLLLGALFPVTALATELPAGEPVETELSTPPEEMAEEASEAEAITLFEEPASVEEGEEELILAQVIDENLVASGICGTGVTWTLDADGVLTVSGSGKMEDYENSAAAPWYSFRSSIKKAVFEEGVTSVGSYAFGSSYYRLLTELICADGLQTIGSHAFSYCGALASVTLPDGLQTIGYQAFYDCDALASITLPDGLQTIGSHAFYDCDALTTIEIPGTVDSIDNYTFSNCAQLQTITFHEGIQNISRNSFNGCVSLQSVIIPDSVEAIEESAFYGCSSLKTVTIGSGIRNIGYHAFSGCAVLSSVEIDTYEVLVNTNDSFAPSATVTYKSYTSEDVIETWNIGSESETDATATLYGNGHLIIEGTGAIKCADWPKTIKTLTIGNGITNIPYEAFENFTALETAEIGSSVKTIESYAFYGCTALTTVKIDAYEMQVTIPSTAFPPNATVTFKTAVSDDVVQTWSIGALDETDATATLYSDGRLVISGEGEIKSGNWSNTITSLVIEDGITNVPANAFNNFDSLTRVTLGGDIETIGSNAFKDCGSLSDVTLGSGIINIGYRAFYNCPLLKGIDFPSGLSAIGSQAFYNSGLIGINIPNSVTDIDSQAFANCTTLSSIKIGTGLRWLGDSVFSDCKNLTQIAWNAKSCNDLYADSSVFYAAGKDSTGITLTIGTSVTSIPAYLFYTSSNDADSDINLIAIETNSQRLSRIGAFAFYRCAKLTSVDLGSALKYIDDGAFNSCSALTSVTLPISLNQIGRKAFFRTGLSAVDIFSNVTSIGEDAFTECAASPFVFRGISGTYAEAYAKENQIAFLSYTQSGMIGNLTWAFDLDSKTLTFSGSGAISNYTDNQPWKDYLSLIETISLSDGITTIGNNAFSACSEVGEIHIPASVNKISASAFENCSNLEEFYFYGTPPSFVTDAGSETNTPFPDHTTVYYLRSATGWDSVTWENCTFEGFSDQIVYLYLNGNHNSVSNRKLTRYQGDTVSLEEYSTYALNELRYYTSAADLLSWNTKQDGSGTDYEPDDEITVNETTTLYAQWDVPTISINGITFDAQTSMAWDTWEYVRGRNGRPGTLYLDDYNGIGIQSPSPLKIYVNGNCTIAGGIETPTNTNYISYIYLSGDDTLTINSDLQSAIYGAGYQFNIWDDAAVTILGGNSAPAVDVNSLGIYGDGQIKVTSSYTTAITVEDYIDINLNGIAEISGTTKAIDPGNDYFIGSHLAIYNSTEDTMAEDYDGGAYLRTEPMPWYLTLHANGGSWIDQTSSERTVKALLTEKADLTPYSKLLTNDGFILAGWCDDTDSVEYPVDGQVVSAANLTLFAVWEARSLVVDGSTYAPNKTHSGNGWSYTPASDSAVAHLTLNNYSGTQIYSTGDIRITANGQTSIIGAVGKPAIQSKGTLLLETNGETTIQGGSGESAILATESISVINEGDLSIRGGDGGSAISTPESLEIENNGSFSAVGGTISYALYAEEEISISGSGKDVFVSGAASRPSVSSGNLILMDDLKFYGGDNANVAKRTMPCTYYPYIRIQPKTVLVNLNANGGTIEGLSLLSSEQAQGADNIVLLQAETPERFGFEFTGWNSKADGSGTEYHPGEQYLFDESIDTLNLYAQWTEKDYDVSIGNQIKVRLREKLPDGATALFVSYDTDGKMLSVVSGTVSTDGLLHFPKSALSDAATYKLIFFDNKNRPCHDSYTL